MNSPLYGLALLPEAQTTRELIAFQHAHALPGPVLGSDTNLPHLTLWQCPFAPAALSRPLLERCAQTIGGPVTGEWATLREHENSWMFAHVNTPSLALIQEHLLGLLERHIRREALNPSTLPDSIENANQARYGYRYGPGAFIPHVTLGAGAPLPVEAERAFERQFRARTVTFDRAVFYRAGAYGSCQDVLAQAPLTLRTP